MIIEGSDQLKKGWKEYEFLYKPGNKSARLPVVGTSSAGFHLDSSFDVIIHSLHSAAIFIWSYRFEPVQSLRSSTQVRLGLPLPCLPSRLPSIVLRRVC